MPLDKATAETLPAGAPDPALTREAVATTQPGGPVHDPAGATLDAPAAPPVSAPALALHLDEHHRYELAGEIARGGLGRILEARDRRLRRTVAIKEILTARGDAEARFLREALITSQLQHPSIIPLYDAGRRPSGELFYSMRLVSGSSLEGAIADKPTLTARLSLVPHVIDVAEAMAYAHARRIIHRDLKPQNVLVGSFGETVVIDWGIAKDLAAAGVESDRDAAAAQLRLGDVGSDLTLAGAVVGTPAYMPPEQARGERVDERTDVYALGAILYHVLAGVPPYDDRPVREVLSDLLATPPRPPVPLGRRVRGAPKDLIAVVDKAMAPDPARRYPSAKELASDLQKFQAGQIVGAYAYSPSELLVRWLKRNWAVASLLATAALAGAVSVHAIVDKGRVAEQGRRVAEEARANAAQAEERERRRADDITLQQARLSLDHDPEKTLVFLAQLSPAFGQLSAARVVAADALSRALPTTLRGHTADVFDLALSPAGDRVASASFDRTVRVWDLATGKAQVLAGHTGEVVAVAFAPGGDRVASASFDKTVRVWDLASGEATVLEGHTDWLNGVAFSPDGKQVASCGSDRTVRVWDLAAPGRPQSRILGTAPQRATQVAFSADGASVISAHGANRWLAWDLAGDKPRVLADGRGDGGPTMSSDGEVAVIGGADGALRVVHLRGERPVTLPVQAASSVAAHFSADLRRVAVAGADSVVRVFDVATAKELHALRAPSPASGALAFSRDGRGLAAGCEDQSVILWDLESGASQNLRAHAGQIMGLSFTPDGRRLVSASKDGTLRVWNLASRAGALAERGSKLRAAVFTPDGRRVVSAGDAVRIWDVTTQRGEPLETGATARVAITRDGRLLAAGRADGAIQIWDIAATPGRLVQTLTGHTVAVSRLAMAPGGERLVSVSSDGAVRLWDLASRGNDRVLLARSGVVYGLAVSPDGAHAAAAGEDRVVRVWDLAGGDPRVLAGHESLVLDVAFSPDGKRLASASLDRTARVWDLATGQARVFSGSEGGLYVARFSPAGDQLATGSDSGAIRVWDLATGEGRVLRVHQADVPALAFSADGRSLVSASSDGTARIWDLATGESRALRGHADGLTGAAFSPDGKLVATASLDGTVRLWPDDLPHDPAALRARLATLGASR